MYEGFLSMGNNEMHNAERTAAYVRKQIPEFPLTHVWKAPALAAALGDGDYSSPLVDDAEWVAAADNATHRFYGLYPISVEGIGSSTQTADVTELITDGGLIGDARMASRSIRVRGLLIAADELAAEAGLAWLRNALVADACSQHGLTCGGSDLRFFLTAPDVCDPAWGPDFNSGEEIDFGSVNAATSPVQYPTDLAGVDPTMPMFGEWIWPETDGAFIEWGATERGTGEILEHHGPIQPLRSNHVLNPSFTNDVNLWSSTGTISHGTDGGLDAGGYLHSLQVTPPTYRTNWLPDPSFENGAPDTVGWRSSATATQTVDGTAPQGGHVLVIPADAGGVWLEANMLGPHASLHTGHLSLYTRHPDDITVTVHDNLGMLVFTGTITGIGSGWQRVGLDLPVKRDYVVRVATAGASELRVDGFLLEQVSGGPGAYFDGDSTVASPAAYYFVGGTAAGASRYRSAALTSYTVTNDLTDTPNGPASVGFQYRGLVETTAVVDVLDSTGAVQETFNITAGPEWARMEYVSAYGTDIRLRFTVLGQLDLDQVIIEAGQIPADYFDGSSPAPGADYVVTWDGFANQSNSRIRWTGSTVIVRENWRPTFWVTNGTIRHVTVNVEFRDQIPMETQLEPFERSYHSVSSTSGPTELARYDFDERGYAIDVEYLLVAENPYAYGNDVEVYVPGEAVTTQLYSDEIVNLVPFSSFELAPTSTIIRTNLCTNPSGEAATTGWTGIPGTTGVMAALTNPVVATAFGTHVLHGQWTTASTAAGGGLSFDIPVVAGTPYSFGVAHVLASIITRLQLQVEWRTASTTISTVSTNNQVVTVANTAVENSTDYQYNNLVAPATATIARVKVISVAGTSFANWSIGSFLELDGLMAVVGEKLPSYFDGSSAATADLTYAWTGTVGLSTSTRSALVPTGAYPQPVAAGLGTCLAFRKTDTPWVGAAYLRYEWQVAPTSDNPRAFGQDLAAAFRSAVTPGSTYSGSVEVRTSKNQRMHAGLYFMDATGTGLPGTPSVGVSSVVIAGAWTRLEVDDIVAPAGAAFVAVHAWSDAAGTGYSRWAANDLVDIDGALVMFGTTPLPYFDGATVDSAAYDYSWDGVVNGSTSRRSIHVVVPATELEDPDLPVLTAPPTVPDIDDAAIDIINDWRRYYIDIPAADIANWASTVPTVLMTTDDNAIRQVRIRFYPNPFGYDPERVDPTTFCGEYIVSYVPPNSTFTVSGLIQKAFAEVNGAAPVPADGLLYGTDGGPMTWAELSCGIEHLLTVDVPPTMEIGDVRLELVVNRKE